MPTKKKGKKKLTKLGSGSLGTGGAAKAASAIMKNKQRKCSAMGGKWVGGKCTF
jgi:hypothetical protein